MKATKDDDYEKSNDQLVAKVLDGFDPAGNMQDRRMLYEVTGMRLDREDFQNEAHSSDSEGAEQAEELLLIDYAMMDRFEDEDENDDSKTYSLND